ncbi:MAG: hypothetical protein Q7P63_10690 [Verrucomicrobiota bacterium JB022]|nr:hypothetical protein [Verrucomicrobiota bacterium JB022]
MRRLWQVAIGIGWAASLYGAFVLGRPAAPAPAPTATPPAVDRPASKASTEPRRVTRPEDPDRLQYLPPGSVKFDAALGLELHALEELHATDPLRAYFLATALANSLDAKGVQAALSWLEQYPPPGDGYVRVAGHLSYRLGELLGPDLLAHQDLPGLDLGNALIGWSSTNPEQALDWIASGEGWPEGVEGYWRNAMVEWAANENPTGTLRWLERALAAQVKEQEGGESDDTPEQSMINSMVGNEQWMLHRSEEMKQLVLKYPDQIVNESTYISLGAIAARDLSDMTDLENQLSQDPVDKRYQYFKWGEWLGTALFGDASAPWAEMPELIRAVGKNEDFARVSMFFGSLPSQEFRQRAPETTLEVIPQLEALSVDHEPARFAIQSYYHGLAPSTALEDVALLQDAALRRQYASETASRWLETDPATARVRLMYEPNLPIEAQRLLRDGAPLWQVQQALEINEPEEEALP